ncbi:MAG: YjcQ family protein [Anaerovoracaceae bacterium]
MAINKLKVMLSFMRELNDGNVPQAKDYEITDEEYWDIVDACQDEGYIKGVSFVRGGQGNKVLCAFLDDIKLTVRGLEYLDTNSPAMKTYKGLKELREWLPF